MNKTKFTQSCLPPGTRSVWYRTLLHDSELNNSTYKMDNYVSTLFFDAADENGYDFGQKLNEEKFIDNMDHKNLYNKQNFFTLDKKERLYEKNTEIDKLLAKFDANVEDIWRSSTESDALRNINYQTWFSQNFFSNPHIHYESNLIWSFEQKSNKEKKLEGKLNKNNCDSSFTYWNTLSSPNFQNSHNCFDTMLNAFNATLSNIQKWSTVEECNTFSARQSKKLNGFSAVVIPKETENAELKNNYKQSLSEKNLNSIEEEDLLISTKTHFRPIRVEDIGSSYANTYADGTTFPISNDLEEVFFKRSESGLLYLEADAETPKKYMEFKEKEVNGNKGEWNCDVPPADEFIPKFRLRQSNEKCIQTEEIEDEQIVPSAHESDCESLPWQSDEDEFYFPGDNEMAQYIINTSEEEIFKEKNVNKNDSFLGEKIDIVDASLCHMKEWKRCFCGEEKDWNQNSINFSNEIEWNQIWKMKKTCNSCRSNSEKLSLKDWYRFREELTQEGEQLLLDLSCMQRIYSSSDWCDDDSNLTHDFNNENPPVIEEEMIGGSKIGYSEKTAWWSTLIAKEEYIKNGLDFRCLWNEEQLIPDFLRNERKCKIGKETERKRRNSSNQRACNFHPEGQCRRPHYRFAHFDLTVGCFKCEPCSLFRGARRPLSL